MSGRPLARETSASSGALLLLREALPAETGELADGAGRDGLEHAATDAGHGLGDGDQLVARRERARHRGAPQGAVTDGA